MIYLNEKFFTEIKKFRYEIINNQNDKLIHFNR